MPMNSVRPKNGTVSKKVYRSTLAGAIVTVGPGGVTESDPSQAGEWNGTKNEFKILVCVSKLHKPVRLLQI